MNGKDSSDTFTKQARKVLNDAQEEARRFQHNFIGTEHLLLALTHEKEGIAASVFAHLNIDPNKVRSAVEFVMGHGDRVVSGEIDLSPRTKAVIVLAIEEARSLDHHSVGTGHLLLGLIREGENIALGILESLLDINLEQLREQIIQALSQDNLFHEEDLVQGEASTQEPGASNLPGAPDEKFDGDTESSILPLVNEGEGEQGEEEQGVYEWWSQEASDNLGKIAADAAKMAQKNPGRWVNPLKSYLVSRIRYAQTPEQIHRFLLETVLGEEVIREHLHEYSGGFFQVSSSSSLRKMLLVRVPESEAISALKDSWYEEIYHINDERYGKIIRLIKRMGGVETDKIRAIKSQRCFTESSPLPGYKRFVSADRRFPISISYPQHLSFVYHFDNERVLHVDWDGEGGSLGISRENFGMSAQGGDRNAALVLQGKKDLAQFMLEDFAQREARALLVGVSPYPRKPRLEGNKMVGERQHPIEAKRLVWLTPSGQYGGEWVFFMRAREAGNWSCSTTFKPRMLLPELWTIYNSLLGEEEFNTFLSTFQWLDLDFFRSLPA